MNAPVRPEEPRVDEETGESWGLALLGGDRTGRRIARDDRGAAVRAALAAGIRAARCCRAAHATTDPVRIAARLDVDVIWSTDAPALGSMVRIAEYEPRPATIRVFMESVRAIHSAACSLPVPEIYVAHELFHHLEATALRPVSDLARVTLARLGPWTWRSGVRALSEIAAHAFAQGLLDLPCFPGALDRLARGAPGTAGAPSRFEATAGRSTRPGASPRCPCGWRRAANSATLPDPLR